MALVDLEQLIFDLYRGGRAEAYGKDPETVVSTYTLSEAEKKYVTERNYNALYDLGVHPMLVMYFARVNGVTVPDYLQILRDGAGRRSVSEEV